MAVMATTSAPSHLGSISVISINSELSENGTVTSREEHTSDHSNKAKTPTCNRQVLAAYVAHGWTAMGGAAAGWSAPALPVLMGTAVAANGTRASPDRTTDLHLSLDEASWVAAMLPLGALLAAPLVTFLWKKTFIGPRNSLITLAPLATAAWLVIAFAWNKWLLYGGRFALGVTWGASGVLVPVFVSSLPETNTRKPLNSAAYPVTTFGTMVVCVLGATLSYAPFTAACAALPALLFLILWFIPESPSHLLATDRTDAAEKSLHWYRSGSADFDSRSELAAISSQLKTRAEEDQRLSDMPWLGSKIASRKVVLQALAISIALTTLQLLSGVNAFVFYTVQVLDGIGTSPSGIISALVISAVHFIGSVISSRSIDRMVRRRLILIISSSGMSLCLAVFGVYSYFYKYRESYGIDDIAINECNFIPLVCMVVYMYFYAFGLGPLMPLAIAENLPVDVRLRFLPIVASAGRFVAFCLAKEVPNFIYVCGHYVVFGIFFGGFCAMCSIFVLVFTSEWRRKV